MYTLFLDTHGSEIIVSLYNGVKSIEKRQESEYSHAKFLVPMIESIMKENNVSFENIKDIVVINGPGSFTGLRIGLSVAKVMAYSLRVPITTVSTLKAYLISDEGDDMRLSVIQDNKGFYICTDEYVDEYVEDISSYNEYRRVPQMIDVSKVVQYAKSIKDTNAHLVRANYVKKIEAEK